MCPYLPEHLFLKLRSKIPIMQEVYNAWGDTPDEAVRVLNAEKKRLENKRRRDRNNVAAAAAVIIKRTRSDALHTQDTGEGSPMKKKASYVQGMTVFLLALHGMHGEGLGRPWKELS
jgi:hypothetical protein